MSDSVKTFRGYNLIKPEELELLPTAKTKPDLSLIYPVDPKQLPKELAGAQWPPGE